MNEIFYQASYFSIAAHCVIPAYWGFYNARGILQTFETRDDAVAAWRAQR